VVHLGRLATGPLKADVDDGHIASAERDCCRVSAGVVRRTVTLSTPRVLDLTAVDEIGEIIPESARVVEGDGATSGFLSLFNRADGRRAVLSATSSARSTGSVRRALISSTAASPLR
jgi:hypothetical protein